MTRAALAALLGATIVTGVAVAAAQRPAVLVQAAPGLWEIDGVPGAKAPARECLGDVAALARFEHRARTCSERIISDTPSATIIEYSCGSGGFGRSELKAITPRSLRIETQGISANLPFNYVLQARRVGNCPSNVSAPGH